MHQEVKPSSIAPPAANYALGLVSTGVSRVLHTAGIVGVRPDGSIPDDVGEQADVIWQSLAAICAEAGMGIEDIVSITTYAVVGQTLGGVMSARDRALGGRHIASTLITVPALARPEWKVEITAVAMA
jgi:enamine deaminase RidA (YjgF/YER057c/UK114 family)